MIKLSDFPDGTIVDIDKEPFKKEGDNWVRLEAWDSEIYAMTGADMDALQVSGHVAIMGIPYPVALTLAERADRNRNPEEVILDVASDISELQKGYSEHEAEIDAIKAAEAQEELELESDKHRYIASEAGVPEQFDVHIDSLHRWDTDRVMEIDVYPLIQNEDGTNSTDTQTTLASIRIPSLDICVDTWVASANLEDKKDLPQHVRYAVNGVILLAENMEKARREAELKGDKS